MFLVPSTVQYGYCMVYSMILCTSIHSSVFSNHHQYFAFFRPAGSEHDQRDDAEEERRETRDRRKAGGEGGIGEGGGGGIQGQLYILHPDSHSKLNHIQTKQTNKQTNKPTNVDDSPRYAAVMLFIFLPLLAIVIGASVDLS